MPLARRVYGLSRSALIYYGIPQRANRLARLYAPFVPKGGLCFDVGAHIGNRVACFRRLGARVIAVEPEDDCARILRFLFGNDEDVTIVEAALGRANGEAALHIDDGNPTLSTLSAEWIDAVSKSERFSGVRYSRQQTVPLTTLDRLIGHYGLPDFTKIDVEGFEAEVLLGLSHRLPALSFEYVHVARDAAIACVEALERLDRYEYNHSRGESHVLAAPAWLDARQAIDLIDRLPDNADSGDIYARLARH